jgi:hypothetical protein
MTSLLDTRAVLVAPPFGAQGPDWGGLCSLIGQGEMLFRVSTPSDVCVLCALNQRLMG